MMLRSKGNKYKTPDLLRIIETTDVNGVDVGTLDMVKRGIKLESRKLKCAAAIRNRRIL